MENKIVIDLKENLISKNENIQFLNNNEECVICNQELNKNSDLVLINNLCKCYNAAKICEICFISWISNNNECMICRKNYSDFNEINIFHTNNQNIIEKINDSISIDIETTEEPNISSFQKMKRWLFSNKIKCLGHTIGYSLIAMFLISVKETIEYDNSINSTHTRPFII